MESEGVARIFGRSLEKHNIRYSPFVGDGDSKSYSEVLRLAPYGPAFHIPKEDCIAHVTKRMGTALRKLTTEYKGKNKTFSSVDFHFSFQYLLLHMHANENIFCFRII